MAKVVEEKLGLMKDIVNSEVEAACATQLLVVPSCRRSPASTMKKTARTRMPTATRSSPFLRRSRDPRLPCQDGQHLLQQCPWHRTPCPQFHVGRKGGTTSLKVVDNLTKLIVNLLDEEDIMIIGDSMSFTFLKLVNV